MQQTRSISDLYLISALSAYGLVAKEINRENPKRQKFIFDNTVEIPVWILETGLVMQSEMNVDQIEAYFLADKLLFPGNYHKTLQDIRANIHGYREDNE